ncbi:hypothetical protein [Rufibacter quisquiliarum]|uniref:DUF1735 domain-containing protein n=1 Tax=Rufibacter quisquiliarum TaxID=1549639 RepID=A0A839GUY5_9BACT|nr:hypothetical protein [Rufibacter quisquiliarum]MBA9079295.1 hypothetical protein [Rufibacter quisquiliarum]
MKKSIYLFLLLLSASLTGCFEKYEDRYYFRDFMVEFDEAVTRTKVSGKIYPRVDGLDPASGVVKYRINLIGGQFPTEQVVQFKVVETESTAREGVHYRFPNGNSIVIPANSSFGYLAVEVLPDGSGNSQLVVELVGNQEIKPMDNFRAIGIPITFPRTDPDPALVEKINDITYYKALEIGAHLSATLGSHLNLSTGAIYTNTGADANPAQIDLLVANGSSSNMNLLAPSSSGVSGWGSINTRITAWPVRNSATLIKFRNPSQAELQMFNDLQTAAQVEAAFIQAQNTVSSRTGYVSADDGPGDRVRQLKAGELLFVKSGTGNRYAVIRIADLTAGNAGGMTIQYKVTN